MSFLGVGEMCEEIEAIANSHRKERRGFKNDLHTCRIETASKDFERMNMVGLSRLLKDSQM